MALRLHPNHRSELGKKPKGRFAHPDAAAAALAVHEVIERDGPLENVRSMGNAVMTVSASAWGNTRLSANPFTGAVPRGMELVADREINAPFDPAPVCWHQA